MSATLKELALGFGRPHLHQGLGIRKLRNNMFECRTGLRLRVVFFAERSRFLAYDLMTHDEILAWLRNS